MAKTGVTSTTTTTSLSWWVLARRFRGPLLAGGPTPDGHLQGVVGREQGGLQGQVGHGAGAVPAVDPALDRLPLVGVAVWGDDTHV